MTFSTYLIQSKMDLFITFHDLNPNICGILLTFHDFFLTLLSSGRVAPGTLLTPAATAAPARRR